MSEDLTGNVGTGSGSATALKLDAAGSAIQLKVTDIGPVFDTEYGTAYVVTGTVEVRKGDVSGDPEVGDEGSFLVPVDQNTKPDVPHHISEELTRALKKVRSRELEAGDTVVFARVADVPSKKKGYSPFKKHAVVVKKGVTDLTGDTDLPF